MLNELKTRFSSAGRGLRPVAFACMATVGIAAAACGGSSSADEDPATRAATATATERPAIETSEWDYGGKAEIVHAVAFEDDFFDKPGVTVLLFSSEEECPAPNAFLMTDRVEVFYPADDEGFGEPISVWFKMESAESLQENRPSGFDGELELAADGSSVSGWVDADGIGLEGDASVRASFDAELCG